jgi:hypothetical protein
MVKNLVLLFVEVQIPARKDAVVLLPFTMHLIHHLSSVDITLDNGVLVDLIPDLHIELIDLPVVLLDLVGANHEYFAQIDQVVVHGVTESNVD